MTAGRPQHLQAAPVPGPLSVTPYRACKTPSFLGAAVPYTSSRRGFQAALVLDDHRAALDVVRLAQMRGDFAERLGVASLELCT